MPESRRTIFLAGLLLVLAGLAAYNNSLDGPFLFDDLTSINHNPSIRHGWLEALSPPVGGETVMGRPLLNLSFAFNYSLGGLAPWGYHVLNLAIHLLAGLTLFGLVRRTLQRPILQHKFGEFSLSLAFAVALLWIVHPLQTEAVSYVVQRAESLVSLFYLLTLYFFVRGVDSARSWPWLGFSLSACLLGVFSKEVIATAPLMVWLYDRTFVSGTFQDAWRRRRKYYLALGCIWVPLGWLIIHAQGHFVVSAMSTPQAGVSNLSPGMLWWGYLLKQSEAVVHYLWLTFWPHALMIDYGTDLITNPLEVAPQALLLLLLLAGTLWALVRRPALGFLGAWFFVILAPSSSVVPLLNNTVVEHRVYLALAAILVLVVWGLHALFRQHCLPVVLMLAVVFGGLTFERNGDYRSDYRMKLDLLAKAPGYDRAHYYVGGALVQRGRVLEGVHECREAVRLKPDDPIAEISLGVVLDALGNKKDAMPHYQRALLLDPSSQDARNDLAVALNTLGRWPEAEKEYQLTIQLHPQSPRAHFNYGVALFKVGRLDEATPELAEAVRLQADFAEAYFVYGDALYSLGHRPEAYAQFEESLRLEPESALAHENLGFALFGDGQFARALPHARAAVRFAPNDADAHLLLGNVFFNLGKLAPAEVEYRRALQLRPEYFEAHNNLGIALANLGRMAEASGQFQEALRLKPDYAQARKNLETVNATLGAPH